MTKDMIDINDVIPHEQVLAESLDLIPWFVDFVNFLVTDAMPEDLNIHYQRKFLYDV